MTEVTEYKCPACGGAMEFDSVSQNMKCPYCDTEMTIEEFESHQTQKQQSQPDTQPNDDCHQWAAGETDGMNVFVCESCGGEIIADQATGATSCPFCGNRVVMKGQFSGDLRPDYIIPFKMGKQQAKEAYLRHISNKPFLPEVFKDQNHIDEIKGVYVPFWLFDFLMQSTITYEATDTSHWRQGNTHYTETKFYGGNVAGSLNFERIASDASTAMDDDLMESIEPFDFSQAVPFKPAYLAGYLANRYDVDLQLRMTRAMERAAATTESTLMQQAAHHQGSTQTGGNTNAISASYLYALYPVWILNTTWRNDHFIFAMNGQTGKMVGNLPLDKQQFWLYVLTRGLLLSIPFMILIFIFLMI